MKPDFNEGDQTGISPNHHPRGGTKPIWFLLHTQEGNGTAQSLASYLQNPNSGVSYHYTVDNGGNVIDVVDTDLSSWSVLDANPKAINLCFAGSRASWSRQQWLDNMGRAIDIAAYLAVQDCRKYGIPAAVISPADLGAGRPGIADHNAVTVGLGLGSHTDVGAQFPWDVFSKAVARYSSPAKEPSMADPVAEGAMQLHPFANKLRKIENPQHVQPSTRTPDQPWPYDMWADLWNNCVWDGFTLEGVATAEKKTLVGWVLDTDARVRACEAKLDEILELLRGAK